MVKKIGNMISRYQVTQKVNQVGQHFGRVLAVGSQTQSGTCWATPFLRAQNIENGK